MADSTFLENVLNSLTEPVLVGDTEHKVMYMNRAAAAHYTGGESLMGTSLLDCHNESSQKVMIEVLAAFVAGEDERIIMDSEKLRIYMRAVRDESGALVGYYERYDRPMGAPCE